MAGDDKRITLWMNLDEVNEGKYGKVTNKEWLEKERDRINKTGRRCEIVINPFNSTAAIFYK